MVFARRRAVSARDEMIAALRRLLLLNPSRLR
jgi:hypothetical protein